MVDHTVYPEMVNGIIKPIIDEKEVKTTKLDDEVKTKADFLDPKSQGGFRSDG